MIFVSVDGRAPEPVLTPATAKSNRGRWNIQGDRFALIIPPAFFQTYWFYCLIVVLMLALLWFVLKLRSEFPFEWIDLKTDDDARRLAGVTGLDDPRFPVCVMEKGSVLFRPTIRDLAATLDSFWKSSMGTRGERVRLSTKTNSTSKSRPIAPQR